MREAVERVNAPVLVDRNRIASSVAGSRYAPRTRASYCPTKRKKIARESWYSIRKRGMSVLRMTEWSRTRRNS